MSSKFLRTVKSKGVTKIAFVSICFILMSGFLYFIVGSFLKIFFDYIGGLCISNFPAIDACENIKDGGGGLLGTILSFLPPLLVFRRLLEKSYSYLALLLVSVSILIYGGYLGLKYIHKK